MSSKAQISLDLMAVIGIMLLVFLALFQFYVSQSQNAQLVRDKADATGIAEALASRINSVVRTGDGGTATFDLPKTIGDGKSYSISVGNRRAEINLANSTVSAAILSSDISPADLNPKIGSQVQIRNSQGSIIIS